MIDKTNLYFLSAYLSPLFKTASISLSHNTASTAITHCTGNLKKPVCDHMLCYDTNLYFLSASFFSTFQHSQYLPLPYSLYCNHTLHRESKKLVCDHMLCYSTNLCFLSASLSPLFNTASISLSHNTASTAITHCTGNLRSQWRKLLFIADLSFLCSLLLAIGSGVIRSNTISSSRICSGPFNPVNYSQTKKIKLMNNKK